MQTKQKYTKLPDQKYQNHLDFLAMLQSRFNLAENVLADIENVSHRILIEQPELINEPSVVGIACLLFVCGNDDQFNLDTICRLIAELWHKHPHREIKRVQIYLTYKFRDNKVTEWNRRTNRLLQHNKLFFF